MNKTEMIHAIAKENDMTKDAVEKAVSSFLKMVGETVAAGEKVQLLGFGTFELKVRPARETRHPQTGEKITVDESRTVTFKAGKALKDSLMK